MVADAGAPIRIGHYDLLGELAVGGMATVYVGVERRAGTEPRLVAIKSIRPDIASDDAFHAMFLDEAALAAQIQHPNVIRTLDVASADGRLLIVMEYVEGISIAKLLEAAHLARVPVPIGITVAIMKDVLAGLHAAHEAVDDQRRPLEVVHRDVSPQNVIVGIDGASRLLDFGIAKAASQRHVTTIGEVKGKLAYMPPEQQLAEPVDRRSDVYAAGVVLWEMVAARRLFAARTEEELVRQLLHRTIDPPSLFAEQTIPVGVDRVVLRALARRKQDRWPTAQALAEELLAAAPSAPASEVAAFVRRFGRADIDARVAHIRELREQHAAHTSILTEEERLVLDVLSTGRRRLHASTSTSIAIATATLAEPAPAITPAHPSNEVTAVTPPNASPALARPRPSTAPPPPLPPATPTGPTLVPVVPPPLVSPSTGAMIEEAASAHLEAQRARRADRARRRKEQRQKRILVVAAAALTLILSMVGALVLGMRARQAHEEEIQLQTGVGIPVEALSTGPAPTFTSPEGLTTGLADGSTGNQPRGLATGVLANPSTKPPSAPPRRR